MSLQDLSPINLVVVVYGANLTSLLLLVEGTSMGGGFYYMYAQYSSFMQFHKQ